MQGLWFDPSFRETVYTILGSVFFIGAIIFFLRKRTAMTGAWASIKSWLFITPILLFIIGLPQKWLLSGLTLIAILGVKSFFQITGLYHRTLFVIFSYLAILCLPFFIYYKLDTLYNIMPMIFLAALCLIPLIRNSYKHMIQYIALSLLAYSFLGWCFMHLGKLIFLDKGAYLLIYVVLLTEACDNMNVGLSRFFGKRFNPFSQISPRRSLLGFVLSSAFTFVLAWAMRHMMPLRSEVFWLAAGFCACIAGGFGDITMSVIRRDLGIKDVSTFIIGRGDIMSRMDKLIFVAPIYYYSITYLLHKAGYPI